MRRSVPILAVIALAGSARAERLPLQSDLDRCAIAMVNSGASADLQGQLHVELLVRTDGKVYAAYVGHERGIKNRKLERCVTNQALLWQLPPVAIDYHRAYAPVTFTPVPTDPGGESSRMGRGTVQGAPSVFLPDINNPPPREPLDLEVARETLEIAEFATPAQRGLAELAIRRYPDALRIFRDALAQRPDDAEALRGFAQALAESGGDLKEARAVAERLLKSAPGSVGGREAMIRTCLAARDAKCAVEHWKPATQAKDFAPRSRIFKEELQPAVQQAAADLKSAAAAAPQDAPQSGEDPCAREQGEEKQAVCVVKRCLDAGSAEYAKELSDQNKVEYVAGEWRVKPVGAGRMLVTREIATRSAPPQRHDAMWLVKLGEQLVMQPSNAEARQITLTHNACASRVNAR